MSFLDAILTGTADELATTGSPVSIGEAAPPTTANEQLVTVDATHAEWQPLPAPPIASDLIVAGNGLVLTGTRLDVVGHADGSIDVAEDAVRVGVLASDAQHGNRGGGALHAVVGVLAGFMSSADKAKLDAIAVGALTDPFLKRPTTPSAWDMECGTWSDPDFANNGWTVLLGAAPWSVVTRAGDITPGVTPAAGTYRSTLIGGQLFVQFGSNVTVSKATTSAAYTYVSRVYSTEFSSGRVVDSFVSSSPKWAESGARFYYTGVENVNYVEGLFVGPSTFTLYTNAATISQSLDCVRYIYDPASGSMTSNVVAVAGHWVVNGSTGPRSVAITAAYAGVFIATSPTIYAFGFIRRLTGSNVFPNAV